MEILSLVFLAFMAHKKSFESACLEFNNLFVIRLSEYLGS